LVPGLARLGWVGPVLTGSVPRHEPDGSKDLEATGCVVHRVWGLGPAIDMAAEPRVLRRLVRAIRRFDPDVVHTHMAKAGALGRLAARIVGVPCVHTFHGHHFRATWPRDRLAQGAERRLGRLTAAAVCLTERQRRDVVDLRGILPAWKVHVIAPGLDVARFRAQADRAAATRVRVRHGRDGEALFLWAGRFVPVKDPGLLVDAVAASRRAFRLVMLGSGPLWREIRAGVKARGLGATIDLPGPVVDVASWILACDAVVLSSRSEGAPLLVLEAKALGRPAVVTSVGGVPDLVAHGHDGLWVPPGAPRAMAAALDALAADPARLRDLGVEAGRGVEARFGARRLAAETAALYEQVRRSPVPSAG